MTPTSEQVEAQQGRDASVALHRVHDLRTGVIVDCATEEEADALSARNNQATAEWLASGHS